MTGSDERREITRRIAREGVEFSETFARMLLVLAAAGVFCGYFAINRYTIGRETHSLETFIDALIPFSPIWQWFYFAIYYFLFLPGLLIRDFGVFKRTVAAFVCVQVVAYVCFLAFPVRMCRPVDPFPLDTFWAWGVALNYALDPPFNCFPSLHLANAFLAAFVARRLDRAVGGVALVIAVLIGLSTLFTKQHFLADVFGGTALAYGSYRIFVEPHIPDLPRRELSYGRARLLVLPAAYGAVVLVLFIGYRSGWQPFPWPLPPL